MEVRRTYERSIDQDFPEELQDDIPDARGKNWSGRHDREASLP